MNVKTNILVKNGKLPKISEESHVNGGQEYSPRSDGNHRNDNHSTADEDADQPEDKPLTMNVEINAIAWLLFAIGFAFRFYRLSEPSSVVFDELHYGKFVSLYLRGVFFFDSQPPLGKQLIALSAYVSGYNGQHVFTNIGEKYESDVPLKALRFVPTLFGSFIVPTVYHLIVEMGLTHRTATLAALLIILVFYIHLSILTNAGPHDNIMTSAFQASLEGGLASITKGQPLEIAHGSQITLRHTHGRACWMHSHQALYPVRYSDNRGSSHQQQVTCYSFKDVNNWWIVKKPEINDLVISEPIDRIKDGDYVQLIHGMSGRALNSHDVAAPVSPQNQEVACYIDYNISMPAQNLWKIKLLNSDETNGFWHTISSRVQFIHVNTSQALKFSGKQLPDWGFNQHEMVTDKNHNQEDAVWNVEEHRYTKNSDVKEREREMGLAEFVPLKPTQLSFFVKLFELQYKMLVVNQETVQNHIYSCDSPLDWVTLTKGIAYWVSSDSNKFVRCGQFFTVGYFINLVPYFLSERTLFLHHYLPALVFKLLVMSALIEHLKCWIPSRIVNSLVAILISSIVYTFIKFLPLSYGTGKLTASDVQSLKWRSSWQLIVHKP
ncbi:unnamed protein product [Medioppia subpectinata]|uniref:Protein O-mannosyltransferase 1 n=1 Tax=Medioppia subpectinata TaxID=1979941 RepID=A0A7R9KLE1_9ACAR|nr:unnamed protein product [Medioppia subpectinata]CAG2104417.1 unnamed protein product [Medioppia subpectinata]